MTGNLPILLYLIVTLLVALAVTFAITPAVKRFAQKVGAIDVPLDGRRMHNTPIPRLGGLAIFFGFIASVLIFGNITPAVRGMLLGSVIIVALGVIDDIVPLRAGLKFIVQIAAALVAVYHGNIVDTISNPNILSSQPYLHLGVLAVPLTVIWIVAITNSVNLIDGLDGLAVGVSAISSVMLLIVAFLVAEGDIAVLMAALAGACLGFLPYNKNPAKIFMGDTGATFLGFVLAVVSIQGLFKFYAILSFAVPFLILGLPLFDTVFAFIRRVARGKNPMSADRSHVHHRLIDMGFSQKQAVAILYVISAVLGLSAVVLTSSGEIKAMLFLLTLCVAGGIAVRVYINGNSHLSASESGQTGKSGQEAPDAAPDAALDSAGDPEVKEEHNE